MIEVVNGNIDKALRELSRTLQTGGVFAELKGRPHYFKPSQKRAIKAAARAANIRKYTSTKANKKSRQSISIFSSEISEVS
jgi:ribosomal protein S21